MSVRQQILEKILNDFKGKAVRVDCNGIEIGCVYLNKDGKKCLVGLFIPDGHEAQKSNGSAHGLLENFPDLELPKLSNSDNKNKLRWCSLQKIHDFQLDDSDPLDKQKEDLYHLVSKKLDDWSIQ